MYVAICFPLFSPLLIPLSYSSTAGQCLEIVLFTGGKHTLASLHVFEFDNRIPELRNNWYPYRCLWPSLLSDTYRISRPARWRPSSPPDRSIPTLDTPGWSSTSYNWEWLGQPAEWRTYRPHTKLPPQRASLAWIALWNTGAGRRASTTSYSWTRALLPRSDVSVTEWEWHLDALLRLHSPVCVNVTHSRRITLLAYVHIFVRPASFVRVSLGRFPSAGRSCHIHEPC